MMIINEYPDGRIEIISNSGDYSAVFSMNESEDEVLLTYCDCEYALNEDILKWLFEVAAKFWDINLPEEDNNKDEFEETYYGVAVGLDENEKDELQEFLSDNKIKFEDDLTQDDLFFIVGKSLKDILPTEIERLSPHWQNAKIFTVNGFKNYLTKEVTDNEDEKNLNALLQQCKYFSEGYFKWPFTGVFPGRGIFNPNADIPETGVLSAMGYRVGQSGLEKEKRREILTHAYYDNVPFVGKEYMNEWNTPATPWRLKKISNAIAAFSRNAKNRKNSESYSLSIEQWEDDLKWLKEKFYDGKFDRKFSWPNTEEFF